MAHIIPRALRHSLLTGLIVLVSLGLSRGADTPGKSAAPATTNAPSAVTPKAAPAEPKPEVTITTATTNIDDQPSSDDEEGKHSATITINGGHSDGSSFDYEGILIPLAGITAVFGTPILIVFFICYFKYKRRLENLALAREYLAKGVPVPPQLLDESQRDLTPSPTNPSPRGSQDMRKGFRWAFIGLGVALALYVHSPNSTSWGWGLIPMVIGIGLLISGALQTRLERSKDSLPPPSTPPSTEPPR